MSNSVSLFHFERIMYLRNIVLAAEIDDGQLQSTSEGNGISPGETFMTGYTS